MNVLFKYIYDCLIKFLNECLSSSAVKQTGLEVVICTAHLKKATRKVGTMAMDLVTSTRSHLLRKMISTFANYIVDLL